MYAGGKNGVRIGCKNLSNENTNLKSENGYIFNKIERSDCTTIRYNEESDWGYFNKSWANVEYTVNFSEFMLREEHLYGGLIKGIEWDYKEETRLRVAIRPKCLEVFKNGKDLVYKYPEFDYIYLQLSEDILNRCIITFNPWANKDFIAHAKKIVLASIPSFDENNFYESNVTGTDTALRGCYLI